MSTQSIQKSRFGDFLALVPKVNKNQIQKSRFDDLLALAPGVGKINPRSLDLMSLWPWLQKSAKAVSEVPIWWDCGFVFQKSAKSIPGVTISWLSDLTPKSRRNHYYDLMTSWPWLQVSWFNNFMGLAADVDKIVPRSWDSMMFWHWQNQSHKSRFDDFVALAPEVDKINPRSLDLMLCWPWHKMSKK